MSSPLEGTCTVSQNVPTGLTVSIAAGILGIWKKQVMVEQRKRLAGHCKMMQK